jgi:acyl-CoA thioesterase
VTDAIFVPDGKWLIPGPGACGPWFPGVQHGGAIAGVLARAVEAAPAAQPMMITRLTVDMSRKVPMGRTRVETEIARDGKRVQAVECRYIVDDDTVGRATAMRIRTDESVVAADQHLEPWPEDAPPAGPESIEEMSFAWEGADFVRNFTMHRSEPEPGRSTSWLRLDVPFVAGEATTPTMFAAMVADMIPSAGSVMAFEKYLSINPDLSIHLHRLPEGEWIGHTALVHVSSHGFGQTDAQLFDRTGAIGRSLKSLLIDPR